MGFGHEHRPCARHHSGGEVGPPSNIILDLVVEEGVGGVMTTGVLGGVGAAVEGLVTVTGGLIVWPAPHSSSDSSELSAQCGDPSHLSFYENESK